MTDELIPTEKHIKDLEERISKLQGLNHSWIAACGHHCHTPYGLATCSAGLDSEILQLWTEVSEMAKELNTERMKIEPGSRFSGVLE